MLFTNWMRSYRYRREMNRHWSVSTPRHRSEDDKTICEEQTLIDDLFFWISSIIFTRDEIRDHLSRFFLIFDSDFYLFISLLSLPRSPRTNLISRRSILLNLAQSNSCRFAVRALSDFCKSSNSCNLAFHFAYQVVKSLQWRQILNHSWNDQKNDES
jgi:hypothetical protein